MMKSSLSNKQEPIIKWIIDWQCYILRLPNEVHDFLLQKIEDVETLINYFSSCKKTREMSLLAQDTIFHFRDELPIYKRTFKMHLQYRRCHNFTINIENLESFRILGFVTDMPQKKLVKMSFLFLTSSGLLKSEHAHTMRIVDCGTYREIVLGERKYEYISVVLYSCSEGIAKICFNRNSEILEGRNAIYEKINKDILHTASLQWKMESGDYIISFYTGLPRLK